MNDQVNKPIDINQIFDVLVKYIEPKDNHEEHKYKIESDAVIDPGFSIEGIDVQDGLGRIQGNKDLYRKLLEAFYKDIEDSVSILEKNYKTGDYKANEMLTHSIKGTGANLGIIELSKSAAKLEKMYKNNLYNQKQFDDFTGKFEIVIKGIKKYLNEEIDKVIILNQADIVELDKLTTDLQRLYHELESYNSDAMINARDLNNKLNGSLQNDFKGVLSLIDELQFEEALEALKIFLFKNNIKIQGGIDV
jgi:HPt (histidine-containing phosphotransfer) domain-containing protein